MNDDNNKSVFIPFICVYEPLNLITHSTIGAFLLIRKRSSHWVWKAWAGNVMSSWLKRGELLSVEAQHWEKHVWLKISSRIKRHCRFLTRYTPKLKILLAKCEKRAQLELVLLLPAAAVRSSLGPGCGPHPLKALHSGAHSWSSACLAFLHPLRSVGRKPPYFFYLVLFYGKYKMYLQFFVCCRESN